jgi:hypothetical protein
MKRKKPSIDFFLLDPSLPFPRMNGICVQTIVSKLGNQEEVSTFWRFRSHFDLDCKDQANLILPFSPISFWFHSLYQVFSLSLTHTNTHTHTLSLPVANVHCNQIRLSFWPPKSCPFFIHSNSPENRNCTIRE